MIKEGDIIPDITLRYRFHYNTSLSITLNDNFGEWRLFHMHEELKNKRVVIFALPGAFTPTCGIAHAPRYESNYPYVRKLGIDEVYCTAVNDPFAVDQFRKSIMSSLIKYLPDGNGEFAKAMGVLTDMTHWNYGHRSWRYSMVVDNLKIEKMFMEPGFPDRLDDPYGESSVEKMLVYLTKVGKTSEYKHAPNEFDFRNDKWLGPTGEMSPEDYEEYAKEDTQALRVYRAEAEKELIEEFGEEKYYAMKKEVNDNRKKWGLQPILEDEQGTTNE